MAMRVGIGYDIHPFVVGRPLVIGGVTIPYDRGLAGHSDADVLLHAVADALLGASAQGDLGQHYPNTEPRYQGISSVEILDGVVALIMRLGYRVMNVDAVVIAEAPRLAPFVDSMRARLGKVLRIEISNVSVKATTHERLGALGRGEGIAAQAVCMLADEKDG